MFFKRAFPHQGLKYIMGSTLVSHPEDGGDDSHRSVSRPDHYEGQEPALHSQHWGGGGLSHEVQVDIILF